MQGPLCSFPGGGRTGVLTNQTCPEPKEHRGWVPSSASCGLDTTALRPGDRPEGGSQLGLGRPPSRGLLRFPCFRGDLSSAVPAMHYT